MTSERKPAPRKVSRGPELDDSGFYGSLGHAIKVIRTVQGLERKELAERAGISYAYLSDIESGRGRPSSRALVTVAEALGMRPHELLQQAEQLDAAREAAEPTAEPSPELPPATRRYRTASPRGDPSPTSWFREDLADLLADVQAEGSAGGAARAKRAPGRPGATPPRGAAPPTPSRGWSTRGRRMSATRVELERILDTLSEDDLELVTRLAARIAHHRS